MKLTLPLIMVLAAGLALLFCVNGCNTDETDNITTDGPPGFDISGSWTGTYTTSDSSGDFNFSMTMDADGEVEGMNTRLGRFTGDVTGNRFTIDATDFFATISPNGRSMTGTFTDAASGDVATVEATKN
ncbi:MAG: hypothetical protein JW889_09600 [Verrucomicrobia bacterium]|nr:hypothetical protein [Verrucomicrobiota bacterium]